MGKKKSRKLQSDDATGHIDCGGKMALIPSLLSCMSMFSSSVSVPSPFPHESGRKTKQKSNLLPRSIGRFSTLLISFRLEILIFPMTVSVPPKKELSSAFPCNANQLIV